METFTLDADFPLSDAKWEGATFQDRLRKAVRAAGGNKEVAAKSGVAYSTLNGYMGGSEPKWSNLVRIAAACGVSLDWLATGQAPPKPDAPAAAPPSPPLPDQPERSPRLFATVNIDLLAAALKQAQEALLEANPHRIHWRRFAQMATLLYDEATDRLNEKKD